MIQRLRGWLLNRSVRSLDADSVDFSMAHRQAVREKAILRRLFESFYRECRSMDLRYFGNCPGRRLEIGSGAGIVNEIFPDMITSDVKLLPFVDIVLNAAALPFSEGSLRSIYAINVFHHLADPRAFLREALRVLYPGGGVILIEPFYGLLARWLFKNLHAAEGFDPEAPDWERLHDSGPFSNANQALSYLVFKRDRARFESEFPGLRLLCTRPHTHLWYLVSGGANFRQLAPDRFTPAVRLAERMLAPFNRWIALQHTIVLRKNFGKE